MGQRSVPASNQSAEPLQISIFVTPLGHWGLLGDGKTLWASTLGHANITSVLAAFPDRYDDCPVNKLPIDWCPSLRERMTAYSSGKQVEFADIQLRLPALTTFQQAVLQITRAMPYGTTMSYGELAAKAGHPKAARAVGTVMSNNRFPIIIPCHRVVGSGGGLGGYSAPQGLSLKQRLLQLESDQ